MPRRTALAACALLLGCADPGDLPADTGDGDPEELPPERSGACAASSPALAAHLTWDTRGEDLDLHLVEGDGELESDRDCYFGNCRSWGNGYLDWGVPGVVEDNPALMEDDIRGTGPEIVRIYDPAPGTYTVVVHDYAGSVHFGATHYTALVCLHGELAARITGTALLEDGVFALARVSFPDEVVTVLPR